MHHLQSRQSALAPIKLNCFTTEDEQLFERCFQAVSRQQTNLVSFLTIKPTFAYIDNCANTHVCTDRSMYLNDFKPFHRSSRDKGVGNIGGSASPEGIGTVRWTWKDDNGIDHTMDLQNTRLFPSSPANIISLTQLGLQLQDDDNGTYVRSGIYNTKFVWDKSQYCRSIKHTASYMPLLTINDSTSAFSTFLSSFQSIYDDTRHCSFLTDVETLHLQQAESKEKLLGTNIVYCNPDNLQQKGIILAKEQGNKYKIRLESGTELSVLPETLSILLEKDKPTAVAPPELCSEIRDRLDNSASHDDLPAANAPLDNAHKELL